MSAADELVPDEWNLLAAHKGSGRTVLVTVSSTFPPDSEIDDVNTDLLHLDIW